MQQNLPLPPTHLAPCACGRHEGNLAQLREIEMAELSSEDEEESD